MVRYSVCALFLIVSFALAQPLSAQQSTGSIRGRLVPKLARVSVELVERTSGARLSTSMTDTAGVFTFYDIPFGSYLAYTIAGNDTTAMADVDVNSVVPVEFSIGSEHQPARHPLAYPALTHTYFPRTVIDKMPSPGEAHRIESIMLNVPGVVSGENGRWFVRGEESNLLTVIDGFPINSDLTRINSALINANIIKSAELLRGGLNAEYGPGNVLAITSQTGIGRQFAGRAYQTLGTFSISEQGAVLGGGLNENIGYFVAYNNYSSNRYLDPLASAVPEHAHGSVSSIFAKVDLLLARDLDVLLLGTYNDGTYSTPNSGLDTSTSQDHRTELLDYLFGARINWDINDHSVLSGLGYTRSNSAQRRASGLSTFADSASTARSIAENDRVFLAGDREHQAHGGLLEYSARLNWGGNSHELKLGIGGETIPMSQSLTLAITDSLAIQDLYLSPASSRYDISAGGSALVLTREASGKRMFGYIQDEIALSNAWGLGLGVRYDMLSLLQDESAISPRLLTNYRVAPGFTVRAEYNRTFTPVPLENILLTATAGRDNGLTHVGNSVGLVESQKAHVIDVGALWSLSEYFDLDISGYTKLIENFHVTSQFASSDFLLPVNLEKGTVTGGEMQLRIKGWNSITGQINLTYTNSVASTPNLNGSVLSGGTNIGPDATYYQTADVSSDVLTLHSQDLAASWLLSYDDGGGYFFTLAGRFDGGLPVYSKKSDGTDLTTADLTASGMTQESVDLLELGSNGKLGNTSAKLTIDIGAGLDLRRVVGLPVKVSGAIINALDTKYLTRFSPMIGGAHHGRSRTFVLTLEAAY
ncbi:MAG TPA: TonB-dependent receptor [Candidatus Kapabacteria bacterium]|nr:TonB-dependent receptor [Candidatus Kapabacteria bacterium]